MITENRPLTGLRVQRVTKDGTVYGLARVRFGEGHRYAGHYEVQRVGAAAMLVPFGELKPGPNANQIPPGVEFPDLDEAYRPVFAEPGVMQTRADVTGKNVIFPGDYALLRDLINEVGPGWRLKWTSHETNEYCGDHVVTGTTKGGVRFSGTKYGPKGYTWPAEGDDFILARQGGGRAVLVNYKAAHEYVYGNRARTLTLSFTPPNGH